MLFLLRMRDCYLNFTRVHISCFYSYWLFRDCQNLLSCLSRAIGGSWEKAGADVFPAHPKADICSLVAQANKGTMSLSHCSLQTSLFPLGKPGLVKRQQTLRLYDEHSDAESIITYCLEMELSIIPYQGCAAEGERCCWTPAGTLGKGLF